MIKWQKAKLTLEYLLVNRYLCMYLIRNLRYFTSAWVPTITTLTTSRLKLWKVIPRKMSWFPRNIIRFQASVSRHFHPDTVSDIFQKRNSTVTRPGSNYSISNVSDTSAVTDGTWGAGDYEPNEQAVNRDSDNIAYLETRKNLRKGFRNPAVIGGAPIGVRMTWHDWLKSKSNSAVETCQT